MLISLEKLFVTRIETIALVRATAKIGLILLGILTVAPSDQVAFGDSRATVTFYAMGDVPYAPAEDVLLPKQISEIPHDADFVIHVGDIKRGLPLCTEGVYRKVAEVLGKAAAPVFIIPGDNEWNDCLNPAQAWKY